jgi:hypothetical protein
VEEVDMSALKQVAACAGTWRGTNRLQDPITGSPQDSKSRAVVTALLGGSFVRIDYTWDYLGKPQEGSLLLGYESDTETVTAAWIDSWHYGDRMLICRGAAGPADAISVTGSYAAPPGPDCGWWISIETQAGLRIVMHNITPNGVEDLAVEADYQKGV